MKQQRWRYMSGINIFRVVILLGFMILSGGCRFCSNCMNFINIPNFKNPGSIQMFKPEHVQDNTPAVILIHGIVMNGYHMSWIAWNLMEQGYLCSVYDYPTRLKSIQEHGKDFQSFLRTFMKMNPHRKVHIVSHSMGGLVTRYALSEMTLEERKHIDSVVMLAPPNQGSIAAWYICEHLTSLSTVFQPVPQLSNIPGGSYTKIPEIHDVRFGVISAYYDFLVPAYSTHLSGESMFLTIRNQIHMTIPFSSKAISAIVSFFGDCPKQSANKTNMSNEINPEHIVPQEDVKMQNQKQTIEEILKTAPKNYPNLVWHDEFDADELDLTKWSRIKDTDGIHCSDWNRYTCEQPGLTEVKDGCLICTGIVNPDTSIDKRPYLQGQVTSSGKFDFLYGKIEIRAKFEDQQGAWPAFWLLPSHAKWPDGGEIDIMERLNGDSFVYQTCHSAWTYTMKQGSNPPQGGKADIIPGEFNVYGLEWTENELIWSVNGKDTFRYPRTDEDPKQWPYTTPFYILLDMQLEGGWVGKADPSTLPVHIYIDWVRVWNNPK